VLTSYSQKALAAVYDDTPIVPAQTPTHGGTIFIIASPRPQTGKTFLAELLTDFLGVDGGRVLAFDLNPSEGALVERRPNLTRRSDLATTQDQVALFDRLIVNDGEAKVVDVGHASFERFFALMEEIGFLEEAQRRSLDVVLLFAADTHPASARAYRQCQQRIPGMVPVPVFNDAIVKMQAARGNYPSSRSAAVPLQIAILPPMLKELAEQSGCSFAELHAGMPPALPLDRAFELRSWTKRAFLEFRELELRLLLEKLRASLAP
jgi:hypothetical protein